ncbi:hypothetical protein GEMRC1_008150 [Eukaryota sp. GEM-RC1]
MTFPPSSIIAQAFPREVLHQLIADDLRKDGRRFIERRSVTSSKTNCLSYSDGSAVLRLTTTAVMVSIRCQATPSSDSDPWFTLSVNYPGVVCVPSKPEIEPVLTSLLSSYPPLKPSSIAEPLPDHSWHFLINVTFLDMDGAELDAAIHAVSLAFSTLSLPVLALQDGVVVRTGSSLISSLDNYLFCGTFAYSNSHLLVDPCAFEVDNAESTFSLVFVSPVPVFDLSDDVIKRDKELSLAKLEYWSGSSLPVSIIDKACGLLREFV